MNPRPRSRRKADPVGPVGHKEQEGGRKYRSQRRPPRTDLRSVPSGPSKIHRSASKSTEGAGRNGSNTTEVPNPDRRAGSGAVPQQVAHTKCVVEHRSVFQGPKTRRVIGRRASGTAHLPNLGGLRFDRVTGDDFAAWFGAAPGGMAAYSNKRGRSSLRQLLQYAIASGWRTTTVLLPSRRYRPALPAMSGYAPSRSRHSAESSKRAASPPRSSSRGAASSTPGYARRAGGLEARPQHPRLHPESGRQGRGDGKPRHIPAASVP